MDRTTTYTLFASSERYATTNGTGVDASGSREFCAVLNVSSVRGAPTSLDVSIQGSYDGTNYGDFKTALAFTQVTTGTGTECLRFTYGGKYLRAVATIVGGASGTKAYTFSVYLLGKSSGT